jgi:hypothetical protein
MHVDFEILPCRLPIIWLDTSLLVKRAQMKLGANISQLDRSRVDYLHHNIYRLVRNGRLLCPEANQQSEIWRRRNELSSAINEYSLGVYASHPMLVQDRQEQRAMRAYALGTGSIGFPCSDLFSFDPIGRLQENLAERLFVTIVETPSEEMIEQFRRDHSSAHIKWEELRTRLRKDKVSFTHQLGVELRGEMNDLFATAYDCQNKIANGEEPTNRELSSYTRVFRILAQWDGLTDRNLDMAGLRAFFAQNTTSLFRRYS